MPTVSQTINSDTSIKVLDIEETIDSDSAVAIPFTKVITAATTILIGTSQTIQANTTILRNEVELKLFKESDLLTEVGTEANPIAFGSVEAGTSLQHPDNSFVLFNDKGGVLSSVDATQIQLSVLELNIVDELLGTSSGGASQTFVVAFPPIETLDATIVKVNDIAWTEVTAFAGTSPTDEIYTLNKSTGTITFGDGLQGKIPPIGLSIKSSYTPDTILRGKEVSEQLWLGVQSNGVISNTITIDIERATPADIDTVTTLRSPIINVTGVFLNTDPNRLGTNFFTSGSFDANTGTITLGTSLPNTDDVLIDYTYAIDDDVEATFTQIGRTVKTAVLNPIPSNNGKKFNFIIIPPSAASPSSPSTIRFKLRVEFRQ